MNRPLLFLFIGAVTGAVMFISLNLGAAILATVAAESEYPARPPDARVRFAGDSISAGWQRAHAQRNAAVSGTTTALIGTRFAQEVQIGSPAYAHILAGTNDFYSAGKGGPDTQKMLADLESAIDAARHRQVPVIVGTVLPMDAARSAAASLIPAYNARLIQQFGHRIVIADYYNAMVLPSGEQDSSLFRDGIHPNDAGYAVMNQVLDRAVQELLSKRHWAR